MSGPLIEVDRLTAAYHQGGRWRRAIEEVSFSVARGEVFGLVGESGCGKSTVALQLLGLRFPALKVLSGEVRFDGRDILTLPRSALDHLRGARISFVPQNPVTALNPGMRIGAQIAEILLAHGRPRSDIGARLGLAGLPEDQAFQRRYPHQLSGGQQQRVCIAMALACDPDFVVLDEPTTGLDVTTQEQIVDLLTELRQRLGMAMLYVTHDLALLSQLADRIGVMYAGRMVEVAPTRDLFARPLHPYTQGLIAAVPRFDGMPARPMKGVLRRDGLPPGCPFAPRCEHALARCHAEPQTLTPRGPGRLAACWRIGEFASLPPATGKAPKPQTNAAAEPLLSVETVTLEYGSGAGRFRALTDVSLSVGVGETVALVGESGSGKSSLARVIAGLAPPQAGAVRLGGRLLAAKLRGRGMEDRRRIQFVFQNPDASLNPRATVRASLARPFAFFFPDRRERAPAEAAAALQAVSLDPAFARRYPDQLSGGERQRVAIARALIAGPELILCDEILSALDVSVQASILELIARLKSERGVALLFISHDLAVVRMLADRVVVLFRGEIVEQGTRAQVFSAPYHPYSRALLEAAPAVLKPRAPARKRVAASLASASGCAYAGRCAVEIAGLCRRDPPPWRRTPQGLAIRCHHPLDNLGALVEHPQETVT